MRSAGILEQAATRERGQHGRLKALRLGQHQRPQHLGQRGVDTGIPDLLRLQQQVEHLLRLLLGQLHRQRHKPLNQLPDISATGFLADLLQQMVERLLRLLLGQLHW
jgi:hypothetical protein